MEKKMLFPKIGGLLHGGDYNPDQWLDRPDILAKDIELMKKAHVNVVSLGIFAWAALEPEEGVYRFEWMEKIINDLYANGITNVHVYSMNNPDVAAKIQANLSDILGK